MATKIRLQRFGKKSRPFYHVVVADARAPRDGKFIERIGSYNPNTNPATIDLNFDKALDWVNKGAQPTDTCRAILAYKGVMYKKHLEGGVKKGALTVEQAEAKFTAWLEAKAAKISGKADGLSQTKAQVKKAALAAEAIRKAEKAAAIEAKNAVPAEVEEVAVEENVTEETAEAATEEVAAEEVAVEEPVAEAPAAEEVAVEEPVAEVEVAPVVEETPAEEAAPAEETPAAE